MSEADSLRAGRDSMARYALAICGIARNCCGRLEKLMPQLEALGGLFRSYEVIVVENDSADGTGAALDAWSGRNARVMVRHFSLLRGQAPERTKAQRESTGFEPARIERIRFARNLYLEELQRHPVDYVAVVDFDLRSFCLDGVAAGFARQASWDGVAANGQRYTLRAPLRRHVYWDTYAFEPEQGFPGGVQRLTDVRAAQRKLPANLRQGNWLRVRSAFGGLCLYRKEMLDAVYYEVPTNDDADIPRLCEHVGLHRAIARRHPGFRLYINPAQEVIYESLPATLTRSLLRSAGGSFRKPATAS